jgi:hypothetical protein
MTRNDAKDAIAVALQADAHSDSTANLFAQQLATALDALGLLSLATPPISAHELAEQGAQPVAPEPEHWASTRTRS